MRLEQRPASVVVAFRSTDRRNIGRTRYARQPLLSVSGDARRGGGSARRCLPQVAGMTPEHNPPPMSEPPTLFVLVGAERTGSNLLMGLLASHPDTALSGEVYNLE